LGTFNDRNTGAPKQVNSPREFCYRNTGSGLSAHCDFSALGKQTQGAATQHFAGQEISPIFKPDITACAIIGLKKSFGVFSSGRSQ